ncbi:multidrug ABC transporter ATPase [Streptomyces rimosus]|uniref:ABC transporter ATP-binding protein YbhF n=1 Tax=Streptomyces rimosus subsp. rimosus TaxID=132474 RepID=A0ABY3Z0K6_STRRM|nr:multidrug ABC transporter ATPase [Streptomyces rimosus]UNZ03847.1 putative ABC transporter ATP-binding protein YbhF [Streptomyces rimosus subsp. rimosus]UTH95354.1 putative ABC transporter ATP-binding protein YbhF [Streptomyces rimosus subsp. rimosus]UTJ13451.1 putative ABC transporter ATP-binding protein YbhF [Streptomyces rimosus subsp. rimosus]
MMNYGRAPAGTGTAAPTAPAAVRARALTVVRGHRTVLDDLTFDVPHGRITGLLGPSGCGKSTLMRAVVGTQAKVGGTLDVLGRPAGHARLRPRIGYVTQAPSVYDDLTVRQNLDYFAAVLHPGRAARATRREQVRRAIEDVALTRHTDALAGHLSGGQRSRVSLAVALLGTPELLVLDEPTVGLDPVLRRDLWQLFHRLATERGATLLVSSHVMDEAERCDRLLLMREGRILAEDTPEALRSRTGTDTVEEAFLHLVDAATVAEREGRHAGVGGSVSGRAEVAGSASGRGEVVGSASGRAEAVAPATGHPQDQPPRPSTGRAEAVTPATGYSQGQPSRPSTGRPEVSAPATGHPQDQPPRPSEERPA